MKKQYQGSAEVDALGRVLRDVMAANASDWDEALYRQDVAVTGVICFDYSYRVGRRLEYIYERTTEQDDLLRYGMEDILREIAIQEGTPAKVGVLSVQSSGQCQFFYDTEEAGMDIGEKTIGLRNGYFTRAEIDPPESMLEELAEAEKWEKLLDAGAIFELSFLESEFGFPCPADEWAVKRAIAEELTNADVAKVVDVSFEEADGMDVVRLRVGVVDRDEGATRITSLMQKIRAPASTHAEADPATRGRCRHVPQTEGHTGFRAHPIHHRGTRARKYPLLSGELERRRVNDHHQRQPG